jgi:undecaprenyl-diphosphatase
MLLVPRRTVLMALAVGVLGVGAALAMPGPLRTYFLEENLYEVVPGVYRSAQPSADDLEAMIQDLRVRSVLNLRGERGGRQWLEAEREVTARHDLPHYSVRLNADRMPPGPRLREVAEILDRAPRPLLFHCQGGVERSGLVAAMAVLLDGGDLEAARDEFATSRGFVGFLARSDLPMVLDDYESWLTARGEAHAPERFRAWIATEYAPYFYRARIEPQEPAISLVAGQPATLRFRVTNTSTRPIPFRESRRRGVHLGAFLRAADAPPEETIPLRAGFVDVDLAPGASIDLELPLPPVSETGLWSLHVDLVDEHVKWFGDMGSQPIELPITVHAEG